MSSKAPTAQHAAGRAWLLLVLLAACFAAFGALFVPRLNNYVMSDVDLTAWTTPLAERLAHGKRVYADFVVPVPPGSISLLALVQLLRGRALVLDELVLIALGKFVLALLAYAIAVPLAGRRTAVLCAVATLALLIQVRSELLWETLAAVSAWSSLALGARALLCPAGQRRDRLWLATGFASGSCFAFLQTTALGITGGWALALAYLAWFERAARSEYRAITRRFALGLVAALVATTALALAVGLYPSAVFHALVMDAPALVGNAETLVKNLVTLLFLEHRILPSSLVLTTLAATLGLRAARRSGLHLGNEPERNAPLDRVWTFGIAAAIVASFGSATLLLATRSAELPRLLEAMCNAQAALPAFGLFFASVAFIAHIVTTPAASDARAVHVGHVFNALLLVALAAAIGHDMGFSLAFLGFPYSQNPSVALGFLFLFVVIFRARLPWVAGALTVAALAMLFGSKLNRALVAHSRVDSGPWAGLSVNYRGKELLRAAQRVQELTLPSETVLVLPEDAALVSLFDRPRPPLRGGLVFVSTYPDRLAARDIETLHRFPPKVIVIHPRHENEWRTLFESWNESSGATRVTEHVIERLLPQHYRLDSSFRTVAFMDMGQLDVWLRWDQRQAAEPTP